MANLSLFDPVAKFNVILKSWMKNKWPSDKSIGEEIKLSISENDRQYTVLVDVQGIKKEDIQVDINGNHIAIRAHNGWLKAEENGDGVVYRERYEEMFSRSFALDTDIDETLSEARYKEGVLELKLTKKGHSYGKKLLIH